jgi:hypothetical protein
MIRPALLTMLALFACQPQTPNSANAVEGPAAPGSNGNGDAPDAPVSSEDPPPVAHSPAQPSSDCPITGSSDWNAWINAMPGPNARPTLIVTGKVTVPTGGYRISWGDFRVAESYPVQIFADLTAVPPAGPATQAITTHDVRGDWPMDQPVGSFTIRCGSRVLARVSPVETAR